MSTRSEKAIQLHHKGYNCAQAVVCAYCDLLGLSEEDAYRAAEGFGFGMGGSGEVCGAVSGMALVAGLTNSSGELEGPRTKAQTYKIVKELTKAFQDKNTSVLCRDLLGGPGKPKLRSCDGCVEDAVIILEEKLLADNPELDKTEK